MSTSALPPQQYNQPSRKGKRAWRKNVDISTVQEGLEQKRDEETKGPLLSTLPSTSLFITDTTGSASLSASRSATLSHRQKIHKPLKADLILGSRSAIPSVSTHKRASSPSKTTDSLLPTRSSKRQKPSTYVTPRDLDRLRKRAYGGDTVPKDLHIAIGALLDPWAEPTPVQNPTPEASFRPPSPKPVRAPDTISRPPVSLLASTDPLAAIPTPHQGKSYNPPFPSWSKLLEHESSRAVDSERVRLEALAKETEQQARVEKALAEGPEVDPLLQSDGEDDSIWEGFNSEGVREGSGYASLSASEGDMVGKKVKGRKTKAERNKIFRRKEEEREARHRENMKKKEEELRRVVEEGERERKRVKREAEEERIKSKREGQGHDISGAIVGEKGEKVEDEGELADDELPIEADDDELLRKSIRQGKRPPMTKNLELVLPDELQDSLRLLKPEGNLLRDRFRNLQLRGQIEVRTPARQRKKPHRTTTEKWSYKDWELMV